jgi:hypothetical protein
MPAANLEVAGLIVVISCVLVLIIGIGRWVKKTRGYRRCLLVEGACGDCEEARILLSVERDASFVEAIDRLIEENDKLREESKRSYDSGRKWC